LEATNTTNISKTEELINMYSILQIIERMCNNYYRNVVWPALVQICTLCVVLPLSLCMGKWDIVSQDPRILLLLICIVNGFIGCVFAPYCASKVNTRSCGFLQDQCRVFFSPYLRKRNFSKPILSIKIGDNFMDIQFPLTVLMFCVNNVFSLLIILKESQ